MANLNYFALETHINWTTASVFTYDTENKLHLPEIPSLTEMFQSLLHDVACTHGMGWEYYILFETPSIFRVLSI